MFGDGYQVEPFEEDESKLSYSVKLRRWWKLKKDEMRWKGWRAFVPYRLEHRYYQVKNWFRPYNVIKIKTLGRDWCDRDSVLLHAAFQVLSDFVEKEWMPSQYHGKLFDLEKEEKRMRDENDGKLEEYHQQELEMLKYQNDHTAEIWHLYVWWKHFRPNRVDPSDEFDMILPCPRKWKVIAVDKDGDPAFYQWEADEADKDLEAARTALAHASHNFDEECAQEDEDMLIRLIKVRRHLWT
jgi:hypothetical protein